jgi:hypothetical protein
MIETVVVVRSGDLKASIGVEDLPDGSCRLIYKLGDHELEPTAILALARTVADWLPTRLHGRVLEGFLAEREFGEAALKGFLGL